MCVCVVCACGMCVMWCVCVVCVWCGVHWRSDDNFMESVFSFHHVGLSDRVLGFMAGIFYLQNCSSYWFPSIFCLLVLSCSDMLVPVLFYYLLRSNM